MVDVSTKVHPLPLHLSVGFIGRLLTISPTTNSLAPHVGRLVMTKSGLDSPKDTKSLAADNRVVELELVMSSLVSACLKKEVMLD
jgi:hypothetical protein